MSNARSGDGRHRDALARVVHACGVRHLVTRSADELQAALDQLAQGSVDVLAVDGGDGTLQATLTALRNRAGVGHEPAVAVLCGGTTNMIHRDVGIAGAPDDALRRLISACRRPGPLALARRPLLALRRDDAAPPEFGFFLGTGLIPHAVRFARRRLHPLGLTGPTGEVLTAAWFLARLATGRTDSAAPDARVCFPDGNGHDRPARLLLATTLDRLILGLGLAPLAAPLRVVALSADHRGLWRGLPALLRGRPVPSGVDGLRVAGAQRIVLPPGTDYVLDGELATAGQNDITVEPAPPVRFVCL